MSLETALAPSVPEDKPAGGNATPDYVRLTAEIRGTLVVEKNRILVIVYLGSGGMSFHGDRWILDFVAGGRGSAV